MSRYRPIAAVALHGRSCLPIDLALPDASRLSCACAPRAVWRGASPGVIDLAYCARAQQEGSESIRGPDEQTRCSAICRRSYACGRVIPCAPSARHPPDDRRGADRPLALVRDDAFEFRAPVDSARAGHVAITHAQPAALFPCGLIEYLIGCRRPRLSGEYGASSANELSDVNAPRHGGEEHRCARDAYSDTGTKSLEGRRGEQHRCAHRASARKTPSN